MYQNKKLFKIKLNKNGLITKNNKNKINFAVDNIKSDNWTNYIENRNIHKKRNKNIKIKA